MSDGNVAFERGEGGVLHIVLTALPRSSICVLLTHLFFYFCFYYFIFSLIFYGTGLCLCVITLLVYIHFVNVFFC